jgi:hypothetical protein
MSTYSRTGRTHEEVGYPPVDISPVRYAQGAGQESLAASVSVPVIEAEDETKRRPNRRIPNALPRRLALPDDGIVDDIALQRAAEGERLTLTTRERLALVDLLLARGMPDEDIARRAGIRRNVIVQRRAASRG